VIGCHEAYPSHTGSIHCRTCIGDQAFQTEEHFEQFSRASGTFRPRDPLTLISLRFGFNLGPMAEELDPRDAEDEDSWPLRN
jgi:hypothetical protein